MINKIQSHIHYKLFLGISAGALIIALISSIIFYTYSFNRELRSYENAAGQLIETISYSAAIAVYLDNLEMVSEVAESLVQNDIIADVIIRNRDKVFYRFENKSSSDDNTEWIYFKIFSPFSSDTQIGTLSYMLNRLLIEEQANHVALRNAVTLISHSLLVAILSMILVYATLTTDLRNIAHILHGINPGKSKKRLPILKGHRKDELGLLLNDINRLLDSADIVIEQKEELIVDLENALQEIKTLRGIIPICSYCKKIRNDEGAWAILEAYITEHTHAELSHGVCPDCLERVLRDLENEK